MAGVDITDRLPAPLTAAETGELANAARQLRVDSIRASTAAGSGHPTSALSAADVIAVLAARHLRYDWTQPDAPGNDHLIFSKGHASPLLYALFKAVGAISDDELLTFRKFGSRLQGHPTPAIPWVDVATGSLGQGLPVAVGIALAGTALGHVPCHVWVLCGDSEMTEGSVWEALDKAGHFGLGNLTAIVDVNRLGQRGETELGWDTGAYRRRIEAFGCEALVIDGHDLAAIDAALTTAARPGERPTVIVAKTVKGKGVAEVEDRNGWHGRAFPADLAGKAITELGGEHAVHIETRAPRVATASPRPAAEPVVLPDYSVGQRVATRVAFGEALRALGARPEVVALDGEVGNSTHADLFGERYPQRYFEMYIAEQQLVAAAVGFGVRGYTPYAATFAAFVSRAFDFVRMAGISGVAIKLVGTHAGTEIGEDGPSQMGLEDIAAMRAVQGSTVLYPADATCAARLVALMADLPGVSYLRATRGAYPVLYPADETFTVGGSKTLRATDADDVTLVGAGVTVHHCLTAADELASFGIRARVIDTYSVKPLDTQTLRDASRATRGRLVVVEDHYPAGGLGEAVISGIVDGGHSSRVVHLAVRGLPASGTPAELMDAAGIGPSSIVDAARALVTP